MATTKRMTRAQIMGELADKTGLSKREIADVFDKLKELINQELVKPHGEFIIPDLVKLKLKVTEAKTGVKYRNPNTGEEIIKDRPASRKVKATPLKRLKDSVI
ncbi:MAG: nucleoid DNA-binding protein [Polyangiales bacterium]|jgi:nucleoid DNA-binding protein